MNDLPLFDFASQNKGEPPKQLAVEKQIYSVSQITSRIRDLLEGSFDEVRVTGEISNLRRQPSGHVYFTLKDEEAQLAVVMFRPEAARLGFIPEDGMEVVAKGEITVYAPRGNYQLRARSLMPRGKGSLQEQFEALKRKLASEGLFEMDRKKELPLFPQKIGVVTSPSGAAIRDFLNVLERRCPRMNVLIFPARVQGAGAEKEILDGLRYLAAREDVDLIVLTRGGGSIEDLWCFNDEQLAREIAACHKPVVSAVGHEIDFTIADFAADLRAPTPSAAAEMVSRPDAEWLEWLRSFKDDLASSLTQWVRHSKWRLESMANHGVFREPSRMLDWANQKLDDQRERLAQSVGRSIESRKKEMEQTSMRWKSVSPEQSIRRRRELLAGLHKQMQLLSPEAVVKRGYAMVLNEKGKVIRTRMAVIKEKRVTLKLADGTVDVAPMKDEPENKQ